MSYNVTSARVKKIENLLIPKAVLDRADAEFDFEESSYTFGENSILTGHFVGDDFEVITIDWTGEFSGRALEDSLKPILAVSKGELEVILIYEGGDSVTKLTSINGVVKEENYDL